MEIRKTYYFPFLDKKKTNTEAGLIVGIVLSVVVAAVIVSVILLGVYGYRNPQSAAGQFLIKVLSSCYP